MGGGAVEDAPGDGEGVAAGDSVEHGGFLPVCAPMNKIFQFVRQLIAGAAVDLLCQQVPSEEVVLNGRLRRGVEAAGIEPGLVQVRCRLGEQQPCLAPRSAPIKPSAAQTDMRRTAPG